MRKGHQGRRLEPESEPDLESLEPESEPDLER